jgi:hypothetical protein
MAIEDRASGVDRPDASPTIAAAPADKSMPIERLMPSLEAVRGVLGKLGEHLGAHLNASTIFGAPVERDGVTVIPVASVRFVFGAGGGGDTRGRGEGQGGGAIGRGHATGYIELKDGRSRFVPTVDPARMTATVGACVLGGMLILRRHSPRRRKPLRLR